ncbi:hypothetical protein ACEUD7_17920 [Aeromonas veronii]
MNINATLLGQFIALLMVIVGLIAWRLARRKSEHPALITLICSLLCLFPPFGLLALWPAGPVAGCAETGSARPFIGRAGSGCRTHRPHQ